jgi:hypothetical protein
LKEIHPVLRKITNNVNEIDTEQSFENSFKEICVQVEPRILHVRSGASEQSKVKRD